LTATLTCPNVSLTPGSMVAAISSRVEIELKEEKMYAHLDEKKERDAGVWVLDTRVTNHMFGCQVTFTKLDTVVLGTMHFGDDSVVRIKGRGTILFICKNNEFW
jgi:hypothetical protein